LTVARTLEKNWELALREQEKLQREYEEHQRSRVSGLTEQQRSLVRQLSQDIPALWNAETTTPGDKQRIVRMLIDRIELKLNIEGNTERTDVTVTWAGGFKDVLREHEWWIGDLAKRLGMPGTTLTNWLNNGWITCRKLPGLRGRWIIWADEAEVARLEQLRAARRRWSDCPFPPELTTPTSNRPDASSL
jgi:hypothetical protein